MEDVCKRAIEAAGGPGKLSAALADITPQAISQWRRVPPDRVLAVEAVTKISRHELRPDVFGPSRQEADAR